MSKLRSPVKITRAKQPAKAGLSYKLGRSVGQFWANFLMGFYSIHIKIRYLHDATYAKNKTYKSWSDKKYSQNVHRATLLAFVFSFIFFTFFQSISPYIFKPGVVKAETKSVTWDSDSDFNLADNDGNIAIQGAGNAAVFRVKNSSTFDFGDASDGNLIIDGTTVTIDKPEGGPIEYTRTPSLNPAYFEGEKYIIDLDPAFDNGGVDDNKYYFHNVELKNGAVITHSLGATGSGGVQGVELYATGTITIDGTSKIDVSGKGNSPLGRTLKSSAISQPFPGGSYGGVGGKGFLYPAGTYDTAPAAYGTEAGVEYFGSAGSAPSNGGGAFGGGRVKISSLNANIIGEIQANGKAPSTLFGGGGSGGGILIAVANLTISNFISAAGAGGSGTGEQKDGLNGAGGDTRHPYGNYGCFGGQPGLGGSGGDGGITHTNPYCSNGGFSAGAGGAVGSQGSAGGGGGAGRIAIYYTKINGGPAIVTTSTEESSGALQRSGTWSADQVVPDGAVLNGTLSTPTAYDASNKLSYTFTGLNKIAWITAKTQDSGKADVTLTVDGQSTTTTYDLFSNKIDISLKGFPYVPERNITAYQSPTLDPSKTYTITIQQSSEKNASSAGYRVVFDKFIEDSPVRAGYTNNYPAGGTIGPWAYFTPVTPYVPTAIMGGTGTASGKIGLRKSLDNKRATWKNLTFVGTVPAGTNVKYLARFSDTFGAGDFVNPQNGIKDQWSETIPPGTYTKENPYVMDVSSQNYISKTIEIYVSMTGMSDTSIVDSISAVYDALDAPVSPKSFKTDGTEINPANTNNYTNESSFVPKASVPKMEGFETDGSIILTPQLEVRADSNFVGTNTLPAGAVFNSSHHAYTGELTDVSFGTVSGLSPNTAYYWKMRFIDNSGRVSAWSNAYSAFSIEQTPPTGTMTINDGANFATSPNVTLNLSATDTGGSSLQQMRFSNDPSAAGQAWSDWENYATTKSWALAAGDGEKTVYTQFRDGAGNISSQILDASLDRVEGGENFKTINSNNVVVLSGLQTNSTILHQGYFWWDDDYCVDEVWGVVTGSMSIQQSGDYGSSPGCTFGRHSYIKFSNTSLTSAILKLSFSAGATIKIQSIPDYAFDTAITSLAPYSTITKTVTPGINEIDITSMIVADRSASPQRTVSAFRILHDGLGSYIEITSPSLVLTQSLPYESSGIFGSRYLNSGTVDPVYGKFKPVQAVSPGTTNITYKIRGGDQANLSDASTWDLAPAVNPGDDIPASLQGKQYLQYQANLTTTDNTKTPILDDVFIEVLNTVSDTIILDTTPPANVTNLKLYSDSGKGTQFNQTTWYTDDSPYFEWDAVNETGIKYLYCFGADPNCMPSTETVSTSFTPPTLTVDGEKYLRVVARDLAGNNSPEVTTFNYHFDKTIPDKVTGVGVSDNDIANIKVWWNSFVSGGGSPLVDYKLERVKYSAYLDPDGISATNDRWNLESDWSTGDGYASFTFASNFNAANPFLDSSVTPTQGQPLIETAIPYIYRVRAKDAAHSDYGKYPTIESIGLTRDTIPPTDPSNVNATACDGTIATCPATDPLGNSNAKGFSISVSWAPSVDTGTGVAKYSVFRSRSNEIDTFKKIGEVNHPNVEFYDNDSFHADPAMRLDDYTTYFYRITATDNAGVESPLLPIGPDNLYRNQDYVITPDITAPVVPLNITATAVGLDGSDPTIEGVGHQRIILAWEPSLDLKARSAEVVPGTITYHVYRSKTNYTTDSEWLNSGTLITPDGTTAVSLEDDALDDLTRYYYKITATDERTNTSGLSLTKDSPASYATTYTSDVPSSPHNVRVNSLKGDPAANKNIGHQVTLEFQGSRSKSVQIMKYEAYRSTTNYATTAEWLTSATKLKLSSASSCGEGCFEFTPSDTGTDILITPTGDDFDTTYRITERGLNDATTYFYRVRAQDNSEVPNQPDQSNRFGPLSVISPLTATLSEKQGWDITPDDTVPAVPANGLEVKVRDTHPNNVELRNIITWKMLSGSDVPTRRGSPDFSRYEVWREIYNPADDQLITSTKIADKVNLADNLYTDSISLDGMTGAFFTKDCKLRYYIVIVDNAATAFRYGNGTVINSYSNYSTKEYAGDSIIPSKSKPKLMGGVTVSNVSVTSATVSWLTDQETDSLVQFKKSGQTDWITIGQIERTRSHTVNLFGLEPSTSYEYQLVSRNYLGNNIDAPSSLPPLATTGFNITPKTVNTTTTTTEISWSTNLDASSAFVEYQLQRQPGDEAQSGTAGVSAENLVKDAKNHSVIIKGLRSNRAYTYKIKSISKDGYLAEHPTGGSSNFETFRTKAFDSGQFTLSPSSSNVAERNITSTNAQIVWETANPTTTWVDYGTKSGIYDISAGNNDLATQHVVVLDGLVPGETYYYRVRVKDANEVEFTSQEYSFRAVLKPKISNLQIRDITPYSVVIAWETNIETETLINWGKTVAYGEKKGIAGMTKNHELKVEGLDDNSEYHFQILARDEVGEEVAADDNIVRTPLDKEGPKIEDVKIDILPLGEGDDFAQVIITWKTNKPATTLIQYDIGLVGGNYAKSSVEDKTLTNAHTVIIKELEVASTYHYRIVARDKRGNETISNDYTFVTPEKNKSIWQLIVRSLEETFSWVKNIGSFFRNIGKKAQ